MFSRLVLVLLVACCAARAAAQAAPNPEHLTSRGRIMVSGAIGGYWSNDKPSPQGEYGNWAVYAHPAVVYLVRDRVGLGVNISVGVSERETPFYSLRDSDVGLGCSGLFDLPLARRVSLFFEPRVSYFEQRRERSLTALGREFPSGGQGDLFQQQAWAAYDGVDGRRFVRFALSAPLVFHVDDNVGLALGPDLWFDVLLGALGYTRTQVGASTTLYVSF